MRDNSAQYDYGKCHVCGEQMCEKEVDIDFRISGKLLIVSGVPAGVCSRCGERIVRSEVGQAINALLEDKRTLRSARKIEVPVVRFQRNVA